MGFSFYSRFYRTRQYYVKTFTSVQVVTPTFRRLSSNFRPTLGKALKVEMDVFGVNLLKQKWCKTSSNCDEDFQKQSEEPGRRSSNIRVIPKVAEDYPQEEAPTTFILYNTALV